MNEADIAFVIETLQRRANSIYRCKLPSAAEVAECERIIEQLRPLAGGQGVLAAESLAASSACPA